MTVRRSEFGEWKMNEERFWQLLKFAMGKLAEAYGIFEKMGNNC